MGEAHGVWGVGEATSDEYRVLLPGKKHNNIDNNAAAAAGKEIHISTCTGSSMVYSSNGSSSILIAFSCLPLTHN